MPAKTHKTEVLATRFEVGVLERLRRIEERVGISVAEQIRRAVKAWLEKQERKSR